VTIPLAPEPRTREIAVAGAAAGTGKGEATLSCAGTWLVLTVQFSEPEPTPPVLAAAGVLDTELERVSPTVFRAALAPDAWADKIAVTVAHERMAEYHGSVHVFRAGMPARTLSLANGVRLAVPSDAPYGVLFVKEEASGEDVFSVTDLWPADLPICRSVRLSFPVPPSYAGPAARLGVYRRGKTGWAWEGGTAEHGFLVIDTTRLGAFQVQPDETRPKFSEIVPAEGAAGTSARPGISARVTDTGSGIADVRISCNGAWLLAVYDPEAKCVTWERDHDLPAGPRTVEFFAVDHAGNETRVVREAVPKSQ